MDGSSVSAIKRAQKESLLFREISRLFMQTALDDTRLQGLCVNRVKLSSDKSVCTVYFYTAQGPEHFNQVLNILTLYKPSLRKALASTIKSRYVPDLVFAFDAHFEKQCRIESLLSSLDTTDTTQETGD
jgi:ribosome-binding factor A